MKNTSKVVRIEATVVFLFVMGVIDPK